ncbi:MAG: translation initiation factor [Myxococcota bacterium]
MGKKKPRPEPKPSNDEGFAHNPFEALAGLTGLPASPKEKLAVPPAATTAEWTGKVVVRRETKGRGGKTVTRISGLPEPRRAGIATILKRRLGCGAVVEGDDVILLGSVVDRAAAWLESEGAPKVVRGN